MHVWGSRKRKAYYTGSQMHFSGGLLELYRPGSFVDH